MPDEQQVVRPLDAEEIKDGVAQTIAEKVRESLNTTCWLYGMAWPKFKATWRVDLTLENFGQEQETFVTGTLHTHEFNGGPEPVLTGKEMKKPREVHLEGEIPYTPPNVFRKDHGMPIPTIVKQDDGSTEQKAVMFKRATGRVKRDTE